MVAVYYFIVKYNMSNHSGICDYRAQGVHSTTAISRHRDAVTTDESIENEGSSAAKPRHSVTAQTLNPRGRRNHTTPRCAIVDVGHANPCDRMQNSNLSERSHKRGRN